MGNMIEREEDKYEKVELAFTNYGENMWRFQAEQKVFQIGKIKIGGTPGKRPVVLIGTLFYHGQKIVTNERTGAFDKVKAEELINVQDEISDKTGNPCMIDVVGVTPEAIKNALDFVANMTDAPILLDSPAVNSRIAGLNYVKEVGLTDRVVYNSLMPRATQDELMKIKEAGIKNAILLIFSLKDFTLDSRLRTASTLLSRSQEIGIDKPLIDTGVLDVPSLGSACQTIFKIKDETGFPVGAGTHNAISTWKGLRRKMGKQAIKPCIASAATLAAAVGADFILYGPIEDSTYVFPAIAMVDAAYGQLLFQEGRRPDKAHPLFKIA